MIRVHGFNTYDFSYLLSGNLMNNYEVLFKTFSEHHGDVTFSQAATFLRNAPNIINGRYASVKTVRDMAETLTKIYAKLDEEEVFYEFSRFHKYIMNQLILLTTILIPENERIKVLMNQHPEWRFIISRALDERPLEFGSDDEYLRRSAAYVCDTILPLRKLAQGEEFGTFIFGDPKFSSFPKEWDAINDRIPQTCEDIAFDIDGLEIDDPIDPIPDAIDLIKERDEGDGGYDPDIFGYPPISVNPEKMTTVEELQAYLRDNLRRESENSVRGIKRIDDIDDDTPPDYPEFGGIREKPEKNNADEIKEPQKTEYKQEQEQHKEDNIDGRKKEQKRNNSKINKKGQQREQPRREKKNNDDDT